MASGDVLRICSSAKEWGVEDDSLSLDSLYSSLLFNRVLVLVFPLPNTVHPVSSGES